MIDKVVYGTEIDFINEVADDCISNMSDKNKEYLIDNPNAIAYHFSYGLYIRNHYIHNRDFSKASFFVEADYLSSQIMRAIFSKLLPEYIYGNSFIEELYENKGFIKLRREYKNIYGHYPVFLVEKYSSKIVLEPVHSRTEWRANPAIDLDSELEIIKRNYEKSCGAIKQLINELAEMVWRTESLKLLAATCGILFEEIEEKIQGFKQIFYEDYEYIPLEICLLPYKKKIGSKSYREYRKILSKHLTDNPSLMENLDKEYFRDRILARSVLKHGWTLRYLPMYQDDDEMVKYSLKHDGTAIQYASRRFQLDREWVKFAIEHSHDRTIMFLDCMEPYRKDKELVYLACEVERWNFVYVDEIYRDDYELAKRCMEQKDNPNRIFSYMSKRLKDNKELVMLDLEEDFPDVEKYSIRLRDDDEVAARLYELHGANSWGWYHMSKRLKEKWKAL